MQRFQLLTQYAVDSLRDPTKADSVAAVGDLSSVNYLRDIRRKMMYLPLIAFAA